jgi:hypothetical protein
MATTTKKSPEQIEREDRKAKKELICTTHDKIETAAQEIADIDFNSLQVNDIIPTGDRIIYLAERIIELVEYAKERGQSMEDRLSAYLNAIEDLGFVRKR